MCRYRRKACLRHSDLRPLESISEPSAGPSHLASRWPCCGTLARGPRQKSWRDVGRIPPSFLESLCWECLQNEECVGIPPSPRQPNPAKKYAIVNCAFLNSCISLSSNLHITNQDYYLKLKLLKYICINLYKTRYKTLKGSWHEKSHLIRGLCTILTCCKFHSLKLSHYKKTFI